MLGIVYIERGSIFTVNPEWSEDCTSKVLDYMVEENRTKMVGFILLN